jgi:tetratricopeptide (TPR) repeat protein
MKQIKVRVLLRAFESLLLVCAFAVCSLRVSAADLTQAKLTQAEDLYKHTDYEQSLALLDKSSSNTAAAFLIGRDYFMLGDFKKSTESLQKAVAADSANSEYFDWLGRAFGRRAETANFVSAIGLASKARQAFERSVQLDPKNTDALSDLFDYYLEAPGFLGGGYDKALAVAEKISAVDPPEGYFAKAKLAQKQKEFSTAEQHLRQSVAAAPHEVGHIIALAKFLANEGRTRESDQMFLAAQRADPNAAQVWFAQADVLIKQKRDLQEAKNLLQKYLNAPITVDDPPKEEAARLLKQVGGA